MIFAVSLVCLSARSIDQAIVYCYLFLVIIVGIFYKTRLKSLKDYALGGKNISFFVIAGSFFATQIGGGSTYGTSAEIYKQGVVFSIITMGYVVASFIVGYFFCNVLHIKYKKIISVSDLIGQFYGGKAEKISAIIGFLFGVGVLSTQMVVLGKVVESFIGFNYVTSILVSSTIVVLYSALGGIWAVAITDVIQFILLGVVVPLLASIMVKEAHGLSFIISHLPRSKIIIESENIVEYICLFLFFANPFHLLQPAAVQRCIILNDSNKIRKMFYIYGTIKALLVITLTLISFSAIIIYNDIDPNNIINHSIDQFLPPVLKGVTICGLLAVIMSTADSHLNTSTVLGMKNIIKCNKLIHARLLTVVIGIISIALAFFQVNIVQVIILLELLYALGVGIPLVYGLVAKNKTLPINFYITFVTSVLLVFYFYIYKVEQNNFIPVIIISLVVLITFITPILYGISCNLISILK